MRIQSFSASNFVQHRNNTSGPNFGAVLSVSNSVYDFEEKEYLTRQLNEHQKIKGTNLKKSFDEKISELCKYCDSLFPKQLKMRLSLTKEAKEYADNPYIDCHGKSFEGNPFVVDVAYPVSVKGYDLSKAVELPTLLENDLKPMKKAMNIVAKEFARLQKDVS